MKKCCQETFKKAIEQVLLTIKINKLTTLEEITEALEYAVSMLKEKESEKT